MKSGLPPAPLDRYPYRYRDQGPDRRVKDFGATRMQPRTSKMDKPNPRRPPRRQCALPSKKSDVVLPEVIDFAAVEVGSAGVWKGLGIPMEATQAQTEYQASRLFETELAIIHVELELHRRFHRRSRLYQTKGSRSETR
jgi:hypothetical protein